MKKTVAGLVALSAVLFAVKLAHEPPARAQEGGGAGGAPACPAASSPATTSTGTAGST